MELQGTNWQYVFFGFIIAGFVLFVFLRAFKYLLPIVLKNTAQLSMAYRIFPVAETMVWVFYFSWYIFRFSEINPYYTIAIIFILLIIIFWISRYFLKDLIAGIIFRASGKFKTGDIIMFKEIKGKVRKFRVDCLEIESPENRVVYIPYGKLIDRTAIKSESTDQTMSYSFLLETKKNKPQEEIIKNIRRYLLSMPWSSVKKDPEVVLREQSEHHYLIEITVFPLDKQYAKKIENLTLKKFG